MDAAGNTLLLSPNSRTLFLSTVKSVAVKAALLTVLTILSGTNDSVLAVVIVWFDVRVTTVLLFAVLIAATLTIPGISSL